MIIARCLDANGEDLLLTAHLDMTVAELFDDIGEVTPNRLLSVAIADTAQIYCVTSIGTEAHAEHGVVDVVTLRLGGRLN